jgi:putative ABC transport system permease protein
MLLYFRLLKESLRLLNALRNNKLRTLLSLLGATIGFSTCAVLTAVDSLDRKIITKDLSTMKRR